MSNFNKKIKDLQGPGIVVAVDMTWEKMQPIVRAVGESDKLVGFKIGYITAFREGGAGIISNIHDSSGLAVVDLQKLGADVPFIIRQQTQEAIDAGADAIIYDAFKDGCELEGAPHALAVYETAQNAGIPAIAVMHMTNEKGPFYEAIRLRMFEQMQDEGIKLKYVVLPANQLEVTKTWINRISNLWYTPKVVGPGIGKQGGEPEIACKYIDVMVVGRAITGAEDPLQALEDVFEKGMVGYKRRENEN